MIIFIDFYILTGVPFRSNPQKNHLHIEVGSQWHVELFHSSAKRWPLMSNTI